MTEKNQTVEEVYDTLKRRIITLEYSPGQVLNEADIASEFGLSRTPVRKIFEQLKNKKLLNIIPRYGAQVASIDFRQMKNIFEVVRELEGYATRLATERISEEDIDELERILDRLKQYDIHEDYQRMIEEDEKFHEIVFQSCGNPSLEDILFDLHMHTERIWFYSQHNITENDIFYDTLTKVVEAIRARDPLKADEYAKEHIDRFVGLIKRVLL